MRSLSRLVPNRTIAWFLLFTILFGMIFTYPAHAQQGKPLGPNGGTTTVLGCRDDNASIDTETGTCQCNPGFDVLGGTCVDKSLVDFFYGVGNPGNPPTPPTPPTPPPPPPTPPEPPKSCYEQSLECQDKALFDHSGCWVDKYTKALNACYNHQKYRDGSIFDLPPDTDFPPLGKTVGEQCVDTWMLGAEPLISRRDKVRLDSATLGTSGISGTFKFNAYTPPEPYETYCQDKLDESLAKCDEKQETCEKAQNGGTPSQRPASTARFGLTHGRLR